jgi:hypothetical protein
MVDFLDSVNLQDLVSEQRVKQEGVGAQSESKPMEVLIKD